MANAENTSIEPKVALQNLVVAVTGEDPISSGVFLGSYRQHAVLQASVASLQRLIGEVEYKQNTKAEEPAD